MAQMPCSAEVRFIGFLQVRKMMVVLVSDFNDAFVSFQVDFRRIYQHTRAST